MRSKNAERRKPAKSVYHAEASLTVAAAHAPAAASSTSEDAALIAMVEAGHWFLKHRKSGETPHKRFVFAKGDSICWSTKEDRGGKLQGQLDGPGLIVVPGAATVVFAAKKRLHEQRRNRIFSVVGAARTLDLEADSEAERHQWVRALTAFVKRADGAAADPLVCGPLLPAAARDA